MLRTIFVLTVLAFGILAAVRSRFAALLLYVWFALFRPQEWMWFDISSYRPSLFLGALLVVPSIVSGVLPNISHPLSFGALSFLAACLLAQSNAVAPSIGWLWLDFFTRLLIVCLLSVTLVSDQRRFKLLLGVVACSFGYHAAKAGLASILSGGLRFSEGLAGSFVDNNGYAVGTVMIAPLLLATAQNLSGKWRRRVLTLTVPFTAITVISTFSRGGFLGLVAAAAAGVAVHRRRVTAMIIVGVVAIPVGVFMSRQAGYFDRLSTIETYEDVGETSALSRIHFWHVAMKMVARHPLGVGLFNYEQAYDAYDTSNGLYGHARAVHSSHFQVLAETGYLGATVELLMFVYAFRCGFAIRRRSRHPDLEPADQLLFLTSANGLIASMAGYLVGAAFVAMALNDLTWLTFSLVASLDRISLKSYSEAEVNATARLAAGLSTA